MEKAVDHNRIMALYPEGHHLIPDKRSSFAKVSLPYSHGEASSYSSSSIQVDDRASVHQLAKRLYDYYLSFDLNLLQLPAWISRLRFIDSFHRHRPRSMLLEDRSWL